MSNLKLSPLIISKIQSLDLDLNSAIPYILALYFGYDSVDTPLSVKKTLFKAGIYILETDSKNKIKNVNWLINPVRETIDPWAWVAEWRTKYRDNAGENARLGGSLDECIKRMKDVFQLQPELNELLVYEITKFYFRNTNKKYIRRPHYFLWKKEKGEDRRYEILEWYEIYKEKNEINSKTEEFNRNKMN